MKSLKRKKHKSIPAHWAKVLSTVGQYTPCYLGGKIWTLNKNNDCWISNDNKEIIKITNNSAYKKTLQSKISK